jgi:hypothetical protein
LSCCGSQKKFYNVEIICPDNPIVTIRYTNLQEVQQAILRAEFEKRDEGTSIDYTAIKLPDKRSVRVEKIAPDQMIKCALRQEEIRRPSKNYIKSIYQ